MLFLNKNIEYCDSRYLYYCYYCFITIIIIIIIILHYYVGGKGAGHYLVKKLKLSYKVIKNNFLTVCV